MEIKKARIQDLPALFELDALVTGSPPRTGLISSRVDRETAHLARIDDRIAGLGLAHRHFFGQAFIELLIVHPDYRRCGIGAALVRSLELNLGPGKLFTSTNTSNQPMQRLCERLGFTRSGIIENLDDSDPELIYFKWVYPT